MPTCPRCKLDLQTDEYESVDALFCRECWGHWLSIEAFTEILNSEKYEFNQEEKDSVLSSWAKEAPDETFDPIVHCPICGAPTTKKPFSDQCPVVLDLCHDHGVWLDASEIKQIQIYFDSLK